MFHSGTLLLLSALAAQAPASPPPTPNRVEICSVVAGTCTSLPAAALDPTSAPLAGGGQLAFVDPATGALVAPNAEQAAELAGTIELAEEQKAAAEPVVETLANGTVRARGDFRVYLSAEIKPAKAEAKEDGQ